MKAYRDAQSRWPAIAGGWGDYLDYLGSRLPPCAKISAGVAQDYMTTPPYLVKELLGLGIQTPQGEGLNPLSEGGGGDYLRWTTSGGLSLHRPGLRVAGSGWQTTSIC